MQNPPTYNKGYFHIDFIDGERQFRIECGNKYGRVYNNEWEQHFIRGRLNAQEVVALAALLVRSASVTDDIKK